MRLHSEARSILGKVISYKVTSGTIDPADLQIIGLTLSGTKPAPNTDEERGIYWLSNMGELEGGSVDDSCFGTLPNVRVAARVKLSAGYLTTSRMVEVPTGDDIEWNFRKSSNGSPVLVRAMAGEFSLTAIVNSSEIHVDILDQPTGVVTRETLQPIGGEVVLPIENSCQCKDEGGPLEDFAYFYRLSKARGNIHLPYRVDGGDFSDTLCPPARFPAHVSA
jgi:hypothetical protein